MTPGFPFAIINGYIKLTLQSDFENQIFLIQKDLQLCMAYIVPCMVPGPAAETLPGKLSEMHILGPTPDILNQKSG